ncbi:Putative pentatricopeptide repeat-containing protein At1g26500, partial [Linum perenne]
HRRTNSRPQTSAADDVNASQPRPPPPSLHNPPPLTHDFFLQVCNRFPSSWRPVHRFHHYIHQTPSPHFSHTPISFNKMLDVYGKARNIDLFWETVHEAGRSGLVSDRTFVIVLRTLAQVRELKKCVQFFHSMNDYGVECSLRRLNIAVDALCRDGLAEEAKYVVVKLKEKIPPDGFTYGCLIRGFCDVGDMIEASKVWNLMVEEGFEPALQVFDKMIETFFKKNEDGEAMKVFQTLRVKKKEELGLSTYNIVIAWLCKKGKVSQAQHLFDEMRERGIQPDNSTWGSILYGLLSRGRVNEAHSVLKQVQNPDIAIYHGLIKGLLRMKRASEATDVFREMINRGCEPIMHTYVMLLQGHLGKRGRKGPDANLNFDTIFVGGLVKAGKSLEATKYVERTINGGVEVPRFDYNKFLHYFSNEEGVAMFEETSKKLRAAGLVDLADVLGRFGEKMTTRDRRRNRE